MRLSQLLLLYTGVIAFNLFIINTIANPTQVLVGWWMIGLITGWGSAAVIAEWIDRKKMK